MTFYSSFSDYKGKVYNVEIHSDNGNAQEYNIKMGGNPCTISSSSNSLFSPIKSRSASLEIVSTEWYFDLYDPTARGTYVKIYEYDAEAQYGVGKIVFWGYLTPCSYDQTFTYIDTITLEAVDALSTCKEFKYNADGTFKDFLTIILSILKECKYRGNLYVPQTYTNINNSNTDITGNVLDKLYISTANFIDDDEAKTRWTQYEVLEEIMQFLGWSMIPDGDNVWCIDYRAENAGSVSYTVYDIQSGAITQDSPFTSDANPTEITANDLAPGESNISIDNIYNKIEISDNLYNIDEISQDIFDDSLHTSVTEENSMGVDQSKWTSVRRKKFLWWEWDSKKEKDKLTGTDYQTICMLKPESGWTHKFYRHSDGTFLHQSNPNKEYYDEKPYYDATTAADSRQAPYNATAERENNEIIKYCNTHGCLLQHYAYVDESHPNNVPATIDWTDILTFFVLGPTSGAYYLTSGTGGILDLQRPVLEYEINEEIQWKPSSGITWLTIKGDLFYANSAEYKDDNKKKKLTIVNLDESWYTTCPIDKSMSSLPNDLNYLGINDEAYRSESNPDYGNGFAMWKMQLQIGDSYLEEYYDSANHKWKLRWTNNSSSYFRLRYNNNPDNSKDSYEFFPAFQWVSVVNNMNFKDKVGVDGFAIPIPSDSSDPFHEYGATPTRGGLKLTIYTPALATEELLDKYGINLPVGFGYVAPVIYCKDFELGYVYTDTDVWYNSHEDTNKADKVYVGYIDDDYVNEFSSLQFRINTSLKDKPIARSFVATSSGYLSTLKHVCGDESKAQEYNVVDLYLDHNSERKVIYDRNMHGYFKPYEKFAKSGQFDGTLMIDSYSYDLRQNNNSIKFIAF